MQRRGRPIKLCERRAQLYYVLIRRPKLSVLYQLYFVLTHFIVYQLLTIEHGLISNQHVREEVFYRCRSKLFKSKYIFNSKK